MESYREYTYNAFNQTETVTVETYQGEEKQVHTQKNCYDAENMRYGIEEDGESTYFITNGWSVFTELDKDWNIGRRLIRGYGIIAGEKQETKETSEHAGYYYYHLNEHGDTEYLTGQTGMIQNAYTYDAFGGIKKAEELVRNRYTYNGEQYDTISSQYYLRARYYNPLIGRFTKRMCIVEMD